MSKIVRICIYRMPPYVAEIIGVSKVNATLYIYFQPVSFISLRLFFIFLLEINSSFFPYIRLTLLSSKNDDFCSHGSFQL